MPGTKKGPFLKRIQNGSEFWKGQFSGISPKNRGCPFGKLQWKDQESDIGRWNFYGICSGRSALDWTVVSSRRDLHDAQSVVISSDGWNHFKFDSMWCSHTESIYTPETLTAGTQKITQCKSGKTFEPNLHGFGFLNVIFQGCRFKMDISMDPCELVHSGLLPEQSRLVRESWRGDD